MIRAMETTYFFVVDGQSLGPFDEGAIKQRITEHTITSDTLAWYEDVTEWQPARAIPELLGAFSPEEKVAAIPPPLPGGSSTARYSPPPSNNKVHSDSKQPLKSPASTLGREKENWVIDDIDSQGRRSYRLFLQILPRNSPLRPFLERNPGMTTPHLGDGPGRSAAYSRISGGYAEQPMQQPGIPTGDWRGQYRDWRDVQDYTQQILDKTFKRRLDADDQMDDLRRRATFPDLYGGNND